MQSDFGTIDPANKSGGALADDLNDWRDAIHTSHLGPEDPPYIKSGMIWIREISSTLWELLVKAPIGNIRIGLFNPSTGAWDLTCAGGTFTSIPNGPEVDPDSDNDLVRKKYVDDKVAAFISPGTRMLFAQTAAPTGWTKDTNPGLNHALRVTGGSAGWGGAIGFTAAFTSRGISAWSDNTTLTEWMMPIHRHAMANAGNIIKLNADSFLGYSYPNNNGAYIGWGTLADTNDAGGGGWHNHPVYVNNLDMNVAYVDVIVAWKN